MNHATNSSSRPPAPTPRHLRRKRKSLQGAKRWHRLLVEVLEDRRLLSSAEFGEDPPASSGLLRADDPSLDFVAPPQQVMPGPDSIFTGQFVVRLPEATISADLAGQYHAVHEVHYDDARNLNLWTVPGLASPSEKKAMIRATNTDLRMTLLLLSGDAPAAWRGPWGEGNTPP